LERGGRGKRRKEDNEERNASATCNTSEIYSLRSKVCNFLVQEEKGKEEKKKGEGGTTLTYLFEPLSIFEITDS